MQREHTAHPCLAIPPRIAGFSGVLSRLLLLVLLGCAGSVTTARAVIERVVERSFPAGTHPILTIDSFFGPVAVTTHEAAEVKIVVRESIEAETEAAADEILKVLDLNFETGPGGALTLQARLRHSLRWSWQKWPPIGLRIEVTVPSTCDLKIRTGEGSIDVGALRGRVDLRNESGNIFASAIDGPASLASARGDIAVAACTGELQIDAREGNVMVGRAAGRARISGVGGTIEVQRSPGPLDLRGDGADVKVGLAYPLTGDVDVVAGGGDVLASLERGIAADLNARASAFGEISVRELPGLEVTRGRPGGSKLEGRLQGGGPRVRLRASGGNVRLLGVPALVSTHDTLPK